ncbi:MAG: nuclear transport factor 2 family protein [Fulvivirga sp.]|nr:nuclear transport factor 2 family protein [Fulvivirga sp.]
MKDHLKNDELEIRNLVSNYCLTTDNADVDGFMNCWVGPEDFGGYDSGPFGSMKTWEELKDFEAEHVGSGGGANGKRHQATNVYIRFVNENEALVTHDMLVLEVDNPPMILATGRYNESQVVRTSHGWKFKYRSLELDTGFHKLMEEQGQSLNE